MSREMKGIVAIVAYGIVLCTVMLLNHYGYGV
jgi:hypothetical protein